MSRVQRLQRLHSSHSVVVHLVCLAQRSGSFSVFVRSQRPALIELRDSGALILASTSRGWSPALLPSVRPSPCSRLHIQASTRVPSLLLLTVYFYMHPVLLISLDGDLCVSGLQAQRGQSQRPEGEHHGDGPSSAARHHLPTIRYNQQLSHSYSCTRTHTQVAVPQPCSIHY